MLCYRCGSHVPDGSEACGACGQKFSSGNLRQATGTFSRRKLAGATVEGAPFKQGDLLENRYLIKDVIGAGPLGCVFKAHDKEIDVDLALKTISPKLLQSQEERKSFAREIRLARKLSHNNLVRVYEEGAAEDRPFYTMQHLDGLTLRRIIDLRREKNQTFALREIEPILGQIAAGLDSAHKVGPHTNVKPENVIVLPDLLKLTDFGLGMAIPRQPFAAAQRAKGGHRYLAPEYLAGHDVDIRADIYSLGVILGEMVAGVFPEAGSIPELRSKRPELPPALEALYRRSVNENPLARHASAGELFAELSEVTAAAEPRPAGRQAPPPAPRPPDSHRAERPTTPAIKRHPLGTSDVEGSRSQRRPPPPPPPVAGLDEREPAPSRLAAPPPAPTETEIIEVEAPAHPRAHHHSHRKRKGATARLMGLVVVGVLAGVGGGYLLLTLLKPPPSPAPVDTLPVATARDAGAPRAIDAGLAQVVPAAPADAGRPAISDAQRREEELRAQEERRRAEQKAEDERKRAAEAKLAQDAGKTVQSADKQTCPGGMRLISSGAFKMGASRDDPMMGFDEKPLASVQLGAYCIDYFEYPNRKGANPTTGVTYQAADAACHSKGKRLCTEEEWERACKGPSGLRFPYGNSFDAEVCNTEDAAGEDRAVASTGQFARCRSGFGISDMSGNVAEWTSSKYNDELTDRTLKGGAFDRPDYATRCAARKNGPVGSRSEKIGFRCCADPK